MSEIRERAQRWIDRWDDTAEAAKAVGLGALWPEDTTECYAIITDLLAELERVEKERETLQKRLFNALIDTRIDEAARRIAELEAESCDHCVMTGRGPSRLKYENPPTGRVWCELEDGSSVGHYEALMHQEARIQAARECIEIIDKYPAFLFGADAVGVKLNLSQSIKARFGLDG